MFNLFRQTLIANIYFTAAYVNSPVQMTLALAFSFAFKYL